MEKIAAQKTRIDVVDALRGFAVLAIVLVHNLEHFIFPVSGKSAGMAGGIGPRGI